MIAKKVEKYAPPIGIPLSDITALYNRPVL